VNEHTLGIEDQEKLATTGRPQVDEQREPLLASG
jgi:hypothetical protein